MVSVHIVTVVHKALIDAYFSSTDVALGFYEVSSNHALKNHFLQFITLAASELDTFCIMYIAQNFARLRM